MRRPARTLAAGLLSLLLAGCRGSEAAAPGELWRLDCGPVFAVAAARRAAGRTELLAAAQDGATRWVDAAQTSSAGPRLPANLVQLAAADLDGDGVDELLAGDGAEVRAVRGNGEVLWHYATGGATLYRLAAADLTGNGSPYILLAGTPPVGLTALAHDGAVAWRAEGVRTVFDLAARPAATGEGSVAALLDSWLVARFDAIGHQLAAQRVTLPDTAQLIPAFCAPVGEHLLLLGRATNRPPVEATWALIAGGERAVAAGPGGSFPALGRASAFAGRFQAADLELAAVVDGAGRVTWLRDGAVLGRTEAQPSPVVAACRWPRPDGREFLALGTMTGVVVFGSR